MRSNFDFMNSIKSVENNGLDSNDSRKPFSESIGRNSYLWNVKSIRRIFVIKNLILQKVDISAFQHLNCSDMFEDKLMKQLQKLTQLHLVTKIYFGEIIDLTDVPDTKNPELYRIHQNYNLWEKRYINEKVRKTCERF